MTIARLALAALLLFAGSAQAKSLYVNNSGSPACSDTTTYTANDASNPWCTIGRAAWGGIARGLGSGAQAAQASDTVLISAGTYYTTNEFLNCGGGGGGRANASLSPINSGTISAPITFRGIGTVYIHMAAGNYGATIGARAGIHYVTWDNVRIDETLAPGTACADTGPVVFWMSNGGKLLNSTIRGTYHAWGDNVNGIRTEYVNDCVIANNTIYDINGDFGHNVAAWMMYDTRGCVFEHNRVYNVITGVYVKGDHTDSPVQENNIIRFNWFENASNKCVFLYSAKATQVYQNVMKDCAQFAIQFNAHPANTNVKIVNNTFYASTNTGAGGYSLLAGSDENAPTGFQFFNNILYGPFGEVMNLGTFGIGVQSFEHNVYYNYAAFGSVAGAQRTFATWQGTYLQDTVTPASVNSDPSFVSTAYPGGFKLNVGSPALSRGIDILDLNGNSSTTDTITSGAYVFGTETIGPMAALPRNLYVDNSGTPACSDATTYASNSMGSPWCTVGRAAWGSTNYNTPVAVEAAATGDTVYITPGTYLQVGRGVATTPAFNPVNRGMEGFPITFEGVNVVRLGLSSGSGPTIGANNLSGTGSEYIVWRNFTIDESLAPHVADTGTAVIWHSQGNVIDRVVFNGVGETNAAPPTFNHSAVRIEGAASIGNTVRNSTITNYKSAGAGTWAIEGAGITVYGAINTVLENNAVTASGSGIYMRGSSHRTSTIRKNNLYGNQAQIVFESSGATGGASRIYQNIARCTWTTPSRYGILLRAGANNVQVVNNTIVDCVDGGVGYGSGDPQIASAIVQNNIVSQSSGQSWGGSGVTSLTPITADQNLYFSQEQFSVVAVYTSLANWRTALGGCLNPGNECSSATVNPLFVNAAGLNFRLQGSSTARTMGTDVLDLDNDGNATEVIPIGAYVTGIEVIGPSTMGLLAGPGRPRWRPLWWLWFIDGVLH